MFFRLLKIFLKENYGSGRFIGTKGSQSKKKTILFVVLMVYSFGTIAISNGLMYYNMDIEKEILLYVASYSISFGFLFSLLQANGALFQFKDYDIIAPLPIKQLTTFLAKLVTMLVFIYVFLFAFTIPLIIVYFMKVPFNIISLLFLILSYFLLPFPGIIIGSFISLLLAKISKQFARGSMVQTILLFVVFIGILLVSFISSSNVAEGSFIPVSVIEAISLIYLPNNWFASAVHDRSFLDLLFFILSYGSFTTLMIFLISKLSLKTNQNRTSNKELLIKDKKRAQKSTISNLIKKEWRKFISTPVYIFNCSFGLILLLVISVASVFLKDQIGDSLGGLGLIVSLIAYGFVLTTVYTPAISLSLEGKNFGFLKSLPIKSDQIVLSKILFNLLLELSVILVTFPMFIYSLQLDIISAIFGLLLIISFALFTSFYFSWLNILFPRFDFKNEVEVIKQSLPAFIAIFSGFGLIGIQALIVFALSLIPYFTLNIAIAILTLLNLAITALMYYLIKNKIDLKFYKLEV